MGNLSAQGPLYELRITGNLDVIRQICDAIDQQGRTHLGQFDETWKEIERGIYAAGRDAGVGIGSVSSGDDGHEASDARFDAVMAFRDALAPYWRGAEQVWREHIRRGALEDLRGHGNPRERLAYGLWKHLEHRLLHIGMAGGDQKGWRECVHYAAPAAIAKGVTLTVEEVATK